MSVVITYHTHLKSMPI